jgi:hypothetical protein
MPAPFSADWYGAKFVVFPEVMATLYGKTDSLTVAALSRVNLPSRAESTSSIKA